MAAVTAHLYSDSDRISFSPDGDLALWIRSKSIDVSMILSRKDRDALVEAIQTINAAEDYIKTTGGMP